MIDMSLGELTQLNTIELRGAINNCSEHPRVIFQFVFSTSQVKSPTGHSENRYLATGNNRHVLWELDIYHTPANYAPLFSHLPEKTTGSSLIALANFLYISWRRAHSPRGLCSVELIGLIR